MSPRFTIIIPAYNAEAYLPRCLDSIFSQKYRNYEVIVIDDGSTDGTSQILFEFAMVHPNLHVITTTNQGMASARNRGLEVAQGEYVLFVDSDDRLCPDALEILAQQLFGEDIVGFGTRVFREDDSTYTNNLIESTPIMKGWEYYNTHRLKATPVHFVCVWQRAYRRAFLEENGLRFVDGLRRAEDDLFTTMVMLHAQSVKTIVNVLYTYHVRKGSITRSNNPALKADSLRVQQILADTFIPMQGIDKTAIYQVLASNYINHLLHKGNSLSPDEWEQFRLVSVTTRHRRLYRFAKINPSFLRLYNCICSFLR